MPPARSKVCILFCNTSPAKPNHSGMTSFNVSAHPANLRQFVLQGQCQDAGIVHAGRPPVMPHGIKGVDACGLQHPIAQGRFQPKAEPKPLPALFFLLPTTFHKRHRRPRPPSDTYGKVRGRTATQAFATTFLRCPTSWHSSTIAR